MVPIKAFLTGLCIATILIVGVVSASSPDETGNISVSSNPPGAEIYLGGVPTGYSTPYTFSGIPQGNHEVQCRMDGYCDYMYGIVRLEAGQTVYIQMNLVPIPAVGYITINSTPSGATIFINGNDTGEVTPLPSFMMVTGNYVIQCTKDGYRNQSGNVTIVADQTTDVNMVLIKNLQLGSGDLPSLTLQTGWNFVSVPKKLASGANTAGIFANVDTGGHSMFQYDGATRNFIILTQSSPVQPLFGFWIYSATPVVIPLQFDNNPLQSPPARQLVAGWNSVGFTGTTPTSARNTYLSVQPGWTTSMGFNAASQSYEPTIFNGDPSEYTTLYPMKGYWIYMRTPGTIAAIG